MKKEAKTVTVNPVETREAYAAPAVETMEVRVEQGFAVTTPEQPDDPRDTPHSW